MWLIMNTTNKNLNLGKIKDTWKSIKEESRLQNDLLLGKIRLDNDSNIDYYLGYRIASEEFEFILRIPKQFFKPYHQKKISNEIEISYSHDNESKEESILLEIGLLNSDYFDIFSVFILDIIDVISSAVDHKHLQQVLNRRILKWQVFFEKAYEKKTTRNKLTGQAGELFFLYSMNSHGVNITDLIKGWKGPSGFPKDFIFQDCAVEVKTTLSNNQDKKIRISNLAQLDSSDVPSLFLYHLCIQEVSENLSLSVNYLINKIIEIVTDYQARCIFFESLIDYGVPYQSLCNEDDIHFKIINESNYLIDDNFPKLTQRNVPKGIVEASYSIQLSMCKEYSVPQNAIIEKMRR